MQNGTKKGGLNKNSFDINKRNVGKTQNSPRAAIRIKSLWGFGQARYKIVTPKGVTLITPRTTCESEMWEKRKIPHVQRGAIRIKPLWGCLGRQDIK